MTNIYLLPGYTISLFQDVESCRRTEVDFVEDDIRLVLDEYNSNLITYDLPPGIYTFKDLSEILSTNLQFGFD